MLWNLDYIIDNGYDWDKHHCVIEADTADEAKGLLELHVGCKLKGERFIETDETVVTPACDGPIVYNSLKEIN